MHLGHSVAIQFVCVWLDIKQESFSLSTISYRIVCLSDMIVFVGLFCRKRPIKIRDPMRLRHSVAIQFVCVLLDLEQESLSVSTVSSKIVCASSMIVIYMVAKIHRMPSVAGLFPQKSHYSAKELLILGLFCRKQPIKIRDPMHFGHSVAKWLVCVMLNIGQGSLFVSQLCP